MYAFFNHTITLFRIGFEVGTSNRKWGQALVRRGHSGPPTGSESGVFVPLVVAVCFIITGDHWIGVDMDRPAKAVVATE